MMGLLRRFDEFIHATPTTGPFGLLAEFNSPADLLRAARELHRAGYRRFDVHSPFPIHGMDRAMGLGRSRVPWIVLLGGLTGGLSGLILQWWINVIDYPLVISAKPYFSVPAFIPVTFEMTILFAAFGAVFGMLVLNLLPMLYHPLLKNENFRRATSDGFFISIEARDPRFEVEGTTRQLAELGGRNINVLEP